LFYFLIPASELEKLRAAFSTKQNELADAVKKVDVLTQELEQRKNGESSSVPTPERINRRKKIQNAKDELYRLQSELIVSNKPSVHERLNGVVWMFVMTSKMK